MNNDLKENLEKVFDEFNSSFHHAFILEIKNRDLVFNFFKDKIKEQNKGKKQNINEDLFLNFKVLDILKVRNILEYGKINFSYKHYIVLSFYSINNEAQNALLKFLEEASLNIKIILIIHVGAKLLSTIYSRVYRLNLSENIIKNNDNFNLSEIALKFLKTNKIERMDLKEIKDILNKKYESSLENEEKEKVDREIIEEFLIKLHYIFFQKYEDFIFNNQDKNKIINKENFNENSREYLENIKSILKAIKYIKNNSSNLKILFEYLALKLKVLK